MWPRQIFLLIIVFAVPLENVLNLSWKRLEDFLKTCWQEHFNLMRHLENVLKMSWRHLYKKFWRRFGKVLKTSWRRMTKANMFVLIKTSWKRLEDVFWICVTKANIFVLIKMSWRRFEEVLWRQGRKTSSRRLHDVFTKTNVFFFCIYDTQFT